ncbi:hypothetical protein SAMN04487884_11043 [Butyrivibrio fibrisolvens]|uniref:Uncharacterized protein n=1 Tax=Butyrivibrio fibrisolvens TaxID=831 RepID=A0A1H9RQH9_BUTFI|nr:hypothetical protein SAMN04487884_11043 [Butyrivibrio fibrisolvens]
MIMVEVRGNNGIICIYANIEIFQSLNDIFSINQADGGFLLWKRE